MNERATSAIGTAKRLRDRELEEASRTVAGAADATQLAHAALMRLDAQIVAASVEARALLSVGGSVNAEAARDLELYRRWLTVERQGIEEHVKRTLRTEAQAQASLADSKRACETLERLWQRRSNAVHNDQERRAQARVDDLGALRQAFKHLPI